MLNSAPFNYKSYESYRLYIFEATLKVNSSYILSISDNARWELIFFKLYVLFSPTLLCTYLVVRVSDDCFLLNSLLIDFSPEWLRYFCSFESCLYLSYTSCMITLSFFLHAWEWDFGIFSILRCMSMRLLIALYSPRALLFISQVPEWMFCLLYFYSCFGRDPS